VNETSLKITWFGSPCADPAGVATSETAEQVRVSVTERQRDIRNTSCQASAVIRSANITLKAPLGKRELLGCERSPCRLESAGQTRAS
jgi:hypothetical protein